MLRLMIWIVAAVSIPYFLGGALYGPREIGFSARSPRDVIAPVRSQISDNHGWVQEKLLKVENTLQDAHQFVQSATAQFQETYVRVRDEGIPYLKERIRKPLSLAPRSAPKQAE